MLLSSPDLPDTLIRVLPMCAEAIEEATEIPPEIKRDAFVAIKDVDRVHHFSIYIELLLFVGVIADPNWPALAVPFQVIQRPLGELMSTSDREDGRSDGLDLHL